MSRLDKKEWLIGLLILLNFALLATWWLAVPHPPMGGGDRPRNFLIKELQMTDRQQQSYDSLIKIHRHERELFRQQTQLLKEQLTQQITRADTVEANRIINEIGRLQIQLERMNFDHFRAIRQMCDEKQKQKFDSVIAQMLKMMNGGAQPFQAPPR
jgi:periplasmic protein CpxP/Spy